MFMRFFCAGFSSAALAIGFASPAMGEFRIDDFTQTGDPGLYPTTVEAEWPTQTPVFVDPFGTIGGQDAVRVFTTAPFLSGAQAASDFDGRNIVTLDTAAGAMQMQSIGDGRPMFLVAWTSPDINSHTLDMDLSAEAGLLVRYTSSAEVDLFVQLTNEDAGVLGRTTHSNSATATLSAGSNSLFLPFEAIGDPVSNNFSFPLEDYPDVELDSIDGLSLAITPSIDFDIPEDLVFSLQEVAFVSSFGLAGDTDQDGFVGLGDLELILANWGNGVSPGENGDANNDGVVSQLDRDIVRANWGSGDPPAGFIPEPGSLAGLGLGLLLLMRRRVG